MSTQRRRPGKGMPFRSASAPRRPGAWGPTIRALAVLVSILAVVGGLVAYTIVRRGLSAHDQPSRAEAVLARWMRGLATPQATRVRRNPVPATPQVLQGALEHYADHCATCHANDGSGDTAIGRALYPKAPDMRASATQSLSDGELFSIIEHGIRLTGMPAWGNGTAQGERDSWGLVHFLRRLPTLSADDFERMEALSPKTPAQMKDEEETRRFLSGGGL
ncbi:MAG: c-type cytochrome [Vicinamibacterales bacterium]